MSTNYFADRLKALLLWQVGLIANVKLHFFSIKGYFQKNGTQAMLPEKWLSTKVIAMRQKYKFWATMSLSARGVVDIFHI